LGGRGIVGSGGARLGAGRLSFARTTTCEWCRRRFESYRRNRRFCDEHRRPAARRGDQLAAALGRAIAALDLFERQFSPFPAIAAAGRVARVELQEQLRLRREPVSPVGLLTACEGVPSPRGVSRPTGGDVDATLSADVCTEKDC
jgi:hypothetical protein